MPAPLHLLQKKASFQIIRFGGYGVHKISSILFSLARELEEKRKAKHLTQKQLAHLLKTSQPRVAMMEKADQSVSLDLLVRALLQLGTHLRLAA